MSHPLPSGNELKKLMENVSEEQIQSLVTFGNKPSDKMNLDTLSKMEAMFGQADRGSNKKDCECSIRTCVYMRDTGVY
jgi:hypothetical protein